MAKTLDERRHDEISKGIKELRAYNSRSHAPQIGELQMIFQALAEERCNERKRCLEDIRAVPDTMDPQALYIFELALKHGQPLSKLVSDTIQGTKALIIARMTDRVSRQDALAVDIKEAEG